MSQMSGTIGICDGSDGYDGTFYKLEIFIQLTTIFYIFPNVIAFYCHTVTKYRKTGIIPDYFRVTEDTEITVTSLSLLSQIVFRDSTW